MPLDLMKFLVDHFSGTSYAPYIDYSLLTVLFVGGYALIRKMLGKDGLALIKRLAKWARSVAPEDRGYSPEWESRFEKVRPYLEVLSSSMLALIGLYGALVGGVVVVFAIGTQNLFATVIAGLYFAAGLFYLRKNLIEVSWACHAIGERRRLQRDQDSQPEQIAK